MKRITIILAVFSFVFISSIHADIRLGVKAGVNLANASLSSDAIKTSNFTGFQVGPVIEIGLPLISVDAAVLYNQQGLAFNPLKANKEYFKEKDSRLDVPVNLKFKLGSSLLGCFLTAGPYASLRLVNSLSDQIKNKNFGAGVNVGAGVSLLRHLQIGVNYKISVTDDYQLFNTENAIVELAAKGKARVWSITAAYLF
ncbi:MAG: PorT family protein [Dysgonamonadaceae bacterium]|jgi:opacity protein-like surface antigen|nr:PorT family protein [Dysgonamonadaceae bacterium]